MDRGEMATPSHAYPLPFSDGGRWSHALPISEFDPLSLPWERYFFTPLTCGYVDLFRESVNMSTGGGKGC
jgi:hypothetical protein